jgi:hypothetical protein
MSHRRPRFVGRGCRRPDRRGSVGGRGVLNGWLSSITGCVGEPVPSPSRTVMTINSRFRPVGYDDWSSAPSTRTRWTDWTASRSVVTPRLRHVYWRERWAGHPGWYRVSACRSPSYPRTLARPQTPLLRDDPCVASSATRVQCPITPMAAPRRSEPGRAPMDHGAVRPTEWSTVPLGRDACGEPTRGSQRGPCRLAPRHAAAGCKFACYRRCRGSGKGDPALRTVSRFAR